MQVKELKRFDICISVVCIEDLWCLMALKLQRYCSGFNFDITKAK